MSDNKSDESAESGSAPHTDVVVGFGLASGEETEVFPEDGKIGETAQALNEAAEKLGLLPQVKWTGGSFTVPKEVADKANLGGSESVDRPAQTPQPATITGTDTPAGDETLTDAQKEATKTTRPSAKKTDK